MPLYEHACRSCDKEWLEEYTLEQYDWLKKNSINLSCPACESEDTFRCINHVPVHFKGGGVGWADNGYYQYHAYDSHVAQGKKVEIYERKEDIERVMKGERREAMKARLKREDELAKRHFGPDAAMTDAQAKKRIDAAAEKVNVDGGKKK
jgi:predicted nucleic acid-binding Zn ribbon protein